MTDTVLASQPKPVDIALSRRPVRHPSGFSMVLHGRWGISGAQAFG
jgi:hypothetical protein